MYLVEKQQKAQLLSAILRSNTSQTLVFSRTKHGANNLVKKLSKDGITAAAIHGNKSQAQRTKALDSFKQDSIQVLVATDIAARGIDIHQLESVINFDLPHVPEDYVHRIGRTGRAGAEGLAISLVSSDERKQLRDIERLIKKPIPKADMKEFDLTPVAGAEDYVEEARPPRQPRGNCARGGRNARSAGGGAANGGRSNGAAAGDSRGRGRSQGAGQTQGRTQAQTQNRRPSQGRAQSTARDENGDRNGNRIDADDNRGNRAPRAADKPRPAGGRGANGAANNRPRRQGSGGQRTAPAKPEGGSSLWQTIREKVRPTR
jgi:ATP-dependent RNA helicase RhlE